MRLVILLLLGASAVIRVADIRAIKLWLLQSLIDNVVDVAAPCRCRRSRRHLWRILGQHFPKMLRAFSTARYGISRRMPADYSRPLHTMGTGAGTSVRMTATPPFRRLSVFLGTGQRWYGALSMLRDPVRPCGQETIISKHSCICCCCHAAGKEARHVCSSTPTLSSHSLAWAQ